MEMEMIKERIENHEGRLVKVEVTQESQGKSIDNSEHRLDKLITQQNRIGIVIALIVGATVGLDKIMEIAGKILGG